ncbi:MAG: MoaD/ThiS family protein [candidate division KSB1 bacterium]|nr:MoaD/ThiS family protein [candidate division KSB1 bacterium]MDZ7274836.1 MoaD/ThiS family protein [candidate division KSB1 bacterium]MDZ7288203.1 MoaD/ThiS family protein [candidate division KSB1 bacterium]MDZ7300416.1 MoaD/ThiS family protein [candidate division KSB1 bacterium]MDZ7308129.1 MoaD/ThiS family protein [candidate division KSB1 bacterium]
MAYLVIPSALRGYTEQQARLAISGRTVGEVLEQLARRFPELRRHLYDEQGRLRKFINVFVGDQDIRHLQQEATPVSDDDEISIVPAVAGGGR